MRAELGKQWVGGQGPALWRRRAAGKAGREGRQHVSRLCAESWVLNSPDTPAVWNRDGYCTPFRGNSPSSRFAAILQVQSRWWPSSVSAYRGSPTSPHGFLLQWFPRVSHPVLFRMVAEDSTTYQIMIFSDDSACFSYFFPTGEKKVWLILEKGEPFPRIIKHSFLFSW